MDLKQWKLNIVEEDSFQESDEDEEDTLSLCDLATNNNISFCDFDGSFRDDRSSSNDQDLFEFFSSDFTSKISTYPKDNIIFCGKMIPYKGGQHDNEYSINSVAKSKAKNFYSCNTTRSTSVKVEREKSYRNYWDDFRAEKAYVGERSRWYLLTFGMGRYRGEIELKDVKTRQSKISDGKMRRSLKHNQMEETPSFKREKKWWSFVRILGCQSSHANAMVKASLVLIPK